MQKMGVADFVSEVRRVENYNDYEKLPHLRWPNTVFARALADAIQRAHKDCKNKHGVDTAIILFAQCPLYLCYFLCN